MTLFSGLTIIMTLAMTGAAFALPRGVTETAGAFFADGKPLYTSSRDTTPGKSACFGPCLANWPALTAAADAKPDGDWTLIARGDGADQWAYKGKPLYTFAKDAAGEAATGVSENWALAKK